MTATSVDRRPRPARTRLQPARAGGAGLDRPSSLPRPAAAGGRHRRSGSRSGRRNRACTERSGSCGRRSTPMPDLGRRSRRAVRHDAQRCLRADRLGLARRAGRAPRARHLDEVLQRTTADPPAPGMVEPRKVAPRGYHLPPVRCSLDRSRSARSALLLIIGLLIAAFVAIAVGSVRSPAPFGLAENGRSSSSRDGDIYAIDPATPAATPGR